MNLKSPKTDDILIKKVIECTKRGVQWKTYNIEVLANNILFKRTGPNPGDTVISLDRKGPAKKRVLRATVAYREMNIGQIEVAYTIQSVKDRTSPLEGYTRAGERLLLSRKTYSVIDTMDSIPLALRDACVNIRAIIKVINITAE
jgi:hypothetical protein